MPSTPTRGAHTPASKPPFHLPCARHAHSQVHTHTHTHTLAQFRSPPCFLISPIFVDIMQRLAQGQSAERKDCSVSEFEPRGGRRQGRQGHCCNRVKVCLPPATCATRSRPSNAPLHPTPPSSLPFGSKESHLHMYAPRMHLRRPYDRKRFPPHHMIHSGWKRRLCGQWVYVFFWGPTLQT